MRRAAVSAGVLIALLVAGSLVLTETPVRYTALGRAVNDFPGRSVAVDLCRDNMPAGLGATVSDVSAETDRWTWVIRGQVGGARPGPWTCRVTMADSGSVLRLDSLDLPD